MTASRIILNAACAALLLAAGASAQRSARWVYFTDKGPGAAVRLAAADPGALGLSQDALERRARARGIVLTPGSVLTKAAAPATDALLDIEDLPVHEPYLRALERAGAALRVTSRWFNAASVSCTETQARDIARLPFVARVENVRRWRRDASEMAMTKSSGVLDSPLPRSYGFDYGNALTQLEVINVPAVHDVWIDGTGILVGMVDDGYRWRTHVAMRNTRVLGEYDFIQKDTVVENQDGDTWSQDSHGTVTFSTLAAFLPGTTIGPAFNASFYLAKTEIHDMEIPVEEDNWVAGVEWLESKGAAVVSSSLGYATFDDSTGYHYDQGDFDGKTATTSRAAARAARLGVVISTAMGNEGNFTGTLIAPSDADSILSVGAINFSNAVASFSSNGPTNDGRTKPDVVAPGVAVYCATKNGDSTYTRANGTSLATPLASGVAALVRSARPELTPLQVREAMRSTADNATAPDNSRGWGRLDAWRALLYHGMVISTNPKIFWDGARHRIAAYVLSPNPVDVSSVTLNYSVHDGASTPLAMSLYSSYAGLGSGSGLYVADLPALPADQVVKFDITAYDSRERRSSPYGAPATRHSFRVGEQRAAGAEHIFLKSFTLDASYPNPIVSRSGAAVIRFGVPAPGASVTIEVYDMLGRRLATVADGWRAPGMYSVPFAPSALSSGLYFYSLRSGDTFLSRSLLITR